MPPKRQPPKKPRKLTKEEKKAVAAADKKEKKEAKERKAAEKRQRQQRPRRQGAAAAAAAAPQVMRGVAIAGDVAYVTEGGQTMMIPFKSSMFRPSNLKFSPTMVRRGQRLPTAEQERAGRTDRVNTMARAAEAAARPRRRATDELPKRPDDKSGKGKKKNGK